MTLRFRSVFSVVLVVFISAAASYFAIAERSYAQVNNPPVATPDTVAVLGSMLTIPYENALDNDYDPDGQQLQVHYSGWTYTPFGGGIVYGNGAIAVAAGTTAGIFTIPYGITDNAGGNAYSTVTIFVLPTDGANNAGAFCLSKGEPVNVTNGNMWIEHRDYSLPGMGENIQINRFYNSVIQTSGLFGFGWSTAYDESLVAYGDNLMRLNRPDGQAIYFVRENTSSPFKSLTNRVEGTIVKNLDNSYTLTFKDGRVHDFSSGGRLTRQTDLNGNQTTLGYDTSNRLVSVTDAVGRVLTVTPNSNGTVSQISDAMGAVADYEYFTGTARLKTVTYPDGSKYKFEYDTTSASGKVLLKTVKDAYDNILETHLYDSSARATTSEVHGGQEKFEFDYSNLASSSPYTIVKHKKNSADPYIETKYYFDKTRIMNLVTKSEGVCGCGGGGSEITQFEYDGRFNLVKKTDALLNQTTYSYDANNNLISQTDTLGTQRWTYNTRGQVLTYKDRVDEGTSNNTITNGYDPAGNGNLLTTTDRLGDTTTLTYSSIGQLATVTDARSKTTAFAYDTEGRLIEVTDANNKDTTFGYDARARVTSTTNAKSETTTLEYDLNNRLKKVIFPDTNYVEHTYDLAGRRTATRDPRGNSSTYAYDNAYRLTSVTDALSHSKTFGYDLMSNLTSQTDALGNTTNFEYDDFNRLKKVIYPPSSIGVTRLEEAITYDTVGNVKTRVDTAGRTTSYLYDTGNRLTKITDALTNQTQFEYNLRSHLTKVKDALNQEYVFTYDPLGRKLSETRAGTTMSYLYDEVGNRTKRTDHNGTVTNYAYDDLNRLTSGSMGTYTYDDLSRILTAANSNGTVSFTYDNRGRVDTTTDVYGKVIDYDYDASGNRIGMKLNGTSLVGYSYDDAGRLESITNVPESAVTNYSYDIADRLISKALPNAITTSYSYDDMSRLTRIKDANLTTTFLDRQYGYNTANQIATITFPTRTKTYSYDSVDRLTGVSDSALGSLENYAYNEVGNRISSHLSTTYSYDPFNRLTATESATYAYDNNGRIASRTHAGGLSRAPVPPSPGDESTTYSYSYDSDGRLVEANRATETEYGVVLASNEYRYDALGRRIYQGDSNTQFTYDGDDVIASSEWGGSGISTRQNGPGIDNKLSIRPAGSTGSTYFHADHLGATTGTSNVAGSLTVNTELDSFGNPSGDFTGREYDSFTELYYYRARMYDPQLGRFTSEDPIGFAGGDINVYAYVRNMPLWFRDPSGLQPGADVMANPTFWQGLAAAVAAAAPFVPPAALAAGGAAAIYGASQAGVYTANHPSNPFVNGPWNPFGPPVSVRPLPPPTMSRPYCESKPRAIPFERAPAIPWPDAEPDREGCAEEISECVQICANAQFDPDMKNIWGGSREACLRGCISVRCQKGLKF